MYRRDDEKLKCRDGDHTGQSTITGTKPWITVLLNCYL